MFMRLETLQFNPCSVFLVKAVGSEVELEEYSAVDSCAMQIENLLILVGGSGSLWLPVEPS